MKRFLICFLLVPAALFAHESALKTELVVHINHNGFVPQHVVVEPGTTILFENVGTDSHWVASDDHPSHTGFDGSHMDKHCAGETQTAFDSCASIEPGQSWSFVFNKTGVHSYHDHLWAHLGGTVSVREKTNPQQITTKTTPSIVSRLLGSLRQSVNNLIAWFSHPIATYEPELFTGELSVDQKYQELKQTYGDLVDHENPRVVIGALELHSRDDREVLSLCHETLHEIGQRAFKKYGDFEQAVKFQSDFCGSGYIHGLFEAYFESTPDPTTNIVNLCAQYTRESGRPFDLWQCQHGLGHGLMYLTGGDLKETLDLCSEHLNRTDARYCHNGAYMEIFNIEVLAKEPNFLDPQDPFTTCLAQGVSMHDCHLYVPRFLFRIQDIPLAEVFDHCSRAGILYQDTCIRGVGMEAIKRNSHNPAKAFELCAKHAGRRSRQQSCAESVASMFMNIRGSYQAGVDMCHTAPEQFAKICKQTTERKKTFFSGT